MLNRKFLAVAAITALSCLTVAGCEANDDRKITADSTKSTTTPPATTPAKPTPTKPSMAPPSPIKFPPTEFVAEKSKVRITPETDATKPPKVEFITKPFAVKTTVVQTLQEGSGPVIPPTATVSVDYHGVNGRSGEVFDSSFRRGTPAEFPLNGVVPGFSKAIAGQKAGSYVVVAVTPDDGYGPSGGSGPDILKDDTLLFYIYIHDIVK